MIPVKVEVSEQYKETIKSQLRPLWGEPQETATVSQGFRQGEVLLAFDADKGKHRTQQQGPDYESQR